jgi:hypothetical protein
MCLSVRVEQLHGVYVGVTLRRAETRVTKQFLNCAEVGATFEQMRRE